MTGRKTLDQMNSNDLDQLHDQLARVRNLADRWDNALAPDRPYARALRAALAAPTSGPAASEATEPGHVIPVEGDPAAAHEAIRQMDADTTNPHTGLVVQPYRDHGEQKWVFRCWGTDTCDGWLSLDHYSEQSAQRARDRHVAETHPTTTPCPACRRADQAGLAPAEQHPACAKEQH